MDAAVLKAGDDYVLAATGSITSINRCFLQISVKNIPDVAHIIDRTPPVADSPSVLAFGTYPEDIIAVRLYPPGYFFLSRFSAWPKPA